MRDNPIQFAVVREDPTIEFDLIATRNCQRVLLIGSGGCTALSLQARFPHLELALVDPNPAQLALIQEKTKALALADSKARERLFNVDNDDASGLNACGNFESLFRSLRDFMREFIAGKDELTAMFESEEQLKQTTERLVSHRYWPVAFELFFSDSILLAMFGRDAIQHAEPGSYPRYFQKVLERGLRQPQALKNQFLHHIFLGCYRGSSKPYYLEHPITTHHFEYIERTASAVESYGRYDLVGLSNIFDWMPEDAIAELATRLARDMKSGAILLFRQLNHSKTFGEVFGRRFTFEPPKTTDRMLASDRSLFYSRINVAVKA